MPSEVRLDTYLYLAAFAFVESMKTGLPIFITGDTRSRTLVSLLKENGIGRMVVGTAIKPYRYEPWAFDNGAYTDWTQGREFDSNAYLRRLELAERIGAPLFGVVPDKVAGGLESLERSLEWRDRLPSDWMRYLVVQDGMKGSDVTPVIHLFDGIFLGGSDRFKGTAPRWSKLAHDNCKPFHYGRAGTLMKIQHALASNCDSFDSAFPLWSLVRFKATLDIWQGRVSQGELFPIETYA